MEDKLILEHEGEASCGNNKQMPLLWDETKFFQMKELLFIDRPGEIQEIQEAYANHNNLISFLRCDFPNVVVLNLTRAFSHHVSIQKKLDLFIICHLRTIEVLNLGSNGLRTRHLPKEIYNLAYLKTLILRHNSIRQLPASFLSRNSKLEKLDVTHNDLSFLPASLLKLPCLKTVYRIGNRAMMDNYTNLYLEWTQRVEVRSIKAKRFNTLQASCVQTILSNFPGFPSSSAPLLIYHQFQKVLSLLTMCDYCCRAIDSDVVQLLMFPSNFCGLEYVPLIAYLCSETCAERFDAKCGKVCTDDEDVTDTIPTSTVAIRPSRGIFTCCFGR